MLVMSEQFALKVISNLFTTWLNNKSEKPEQFEYFVTYLDNKDSIYKVLGYSLGAGTSKGTKLVIYQNITTGVIFHREFNDFCNRMQPYFGE